MCVVLKCIDTQTRAFVSVIDVSEQAIRSLLKVSGVELKPHQLHITSRISL